jgi:hypothetical protein
MQACILGVVATLLNVAYLLLLKFLPGGLELALFGFILVHVTVAHSAASLWVSIMAVRVKRLLLPHSSA